MLQHLLTLSLTLAFQMKSKRLVCHLVAITEKHQLLHVIIRAKPAGNLRVTMIALYLFLCSAEPFQLSASKLLLLTAQQVCDFLLDRNLVIPEEQQYTLSLELEPRVARGSISGAPPSRASPAS